MVLDRVRRLSLYASSIGITTAGPTRTARLATGLSVGALYLLGALANLWGTRGRHPGWMLMAAALGLIVVGVT